MNRPCDVLAAATGWANDQHARPARRGDSDLLADAADGIAFANELANMEAPAHLPPQTLQESVQVLRRDLAVGRRRLQRLRSKNSNQQEALIAGNSRNPEKARGSLLLQTILAGWTCDLASRATAAKCFRRRTKCRPKLRRRLLAAARVIIASQAHEIVRLLADPF